MLRTLLILVVVALLIQLTLAKGSIKSKVVAGVFPPETEEPHRVRAVAGVFPPETEEPKRTKAVAGVFPPETEEPRRNRPSEINVVAGVFPPETEEPRRTRAVAGVFPPETEEPRRTRDSVASSSEETTVVAGVFPPETEEPRRVRDTTPVTYLPASVSPIIEDPVPSWASKGDSCMTVKSCDTCASTDSSYCSYTMAGAARCCQRSIGGIARSAGATDVGVASVGPITENPIPSWASDSDVCAKKRSCDSCMTDSYCKYTFTGKPQCCSKAASAVEQSEDSVYSNKIQPSQ